MRLLFASLACLTLVACSTDQVVQDLVSEGWTQHQFQVSGEDPYSYICAPIDNNAEARAAQAHRMVFAGINDIAERAADDLIEGRINSTQFSIQINRESDALSAEVEAATGCLLIDS